MWFLRVICWDTLIGQTLVSKARTNLFWWCCFVFCFASILCLMGTFDHSETDAILSTYDFPCPSSPTCYTGSRNIHAHLMCAWWCHVLATSAVDRNFLSCACPGISCATFSWVLAQKHAMWSGEDPGSQGENQNLWFMF